LWKEQFVIELFADVARNILIADFSVSFYEHFTNSTLSISKEPFLTFISPLVLNSTVSLVTNYAPQLSISSPTILIFLERIRTSPLMSTPLYSSPVDFGAPK